MALTLTPRALSLLPRGGKRALELGVRLLNHCGAARVGLRAPRERRLSLSTPPLRLQNLPRICIKSLLQHEPLFVLRVELLLQLLCARHVQALLRLGRALPVHPRFNSRLQLKDTRRKPRRLCLRVCAVLLQHCRTRLGALRALLCCLLSASALLQLVFERARASPLRLQLPAPRPASRSKMSAARFRWCSDPISAGGGRGARGTGGQPAVA